MSKNSARDKAEAAKNKAKGRAKEACAALSADKSKKPRAAKSRARAARSRRRAASRV